MDEREVHVKILKLWYRETYITKHWEKLFKTYTVTEWIGPKVRNMYIHAQKHRVSKQSREMYGQIRPLANFGQEVYLKSRQSIRISTGIAW